MLQLTISSIQNKTDTCLVKSEFTFHDPIFGRKYYVISRIYNSTIRFHVYPYKKSSNFVDTFSVRFNKRQSCYLQQRHLLLFLVSRIVSRPSLYHGHVPDEIFDRLVFDDDLPF